MYHRPDIETLVVGAGPVGLYAAISLADRGIPVRIIDEEWHTASRSYALALHPASLALLDEMDLAQKVVDRGVRVEKVAFYRGRDRLAEIDLGPPGAGFPFALVLPQSALEDVLQERLRQTGLSVQWNHRLCSLEQQGGRVRAQLGRLAPAVQSIDRRAAEWIVEENVTVRPRFLLGADGHRSAVRREMEIPYECLGPRQHYLVFEFECESRPENEVRVILDEDEASVLWPLPDGRVRWSFELSDGEGKSRNRRKRRIERNPGGEAFPEPTLVLLEDLLESRAPWFDGRPGELHWSATVPFTPRLAETFGEDHVWLLGDAAHQTGPIGVQSMNAGLAETGDLVGRLASILADRSSVATLEDWQDGHHRTWRRLLGFGKSPALSDDAPDWVRRYAPRVVRCLPGTGSELNRLATRLGIGLGPTIEA